MKKDYFKIDFSYLKDDSTFNSYAFVSAWSAETAKQIFTAEISQLYTGIIITKCVKITEKQYNTAMKG